MAKYRVEYVTLSSGRCVPAHLFTCPECEALDLGVDVDTSTQPWKAVCSEGHEFTIDARPQA